MAYDHLSTEQLAQKIEERKRFLTKVVNFAEKLLLERGKLIKEVQKSWNTNVIKRLDNFGNFSFFADWGQSMMGGNDVKIYHHPHLTNIDLANTRPVLHVRYMMGTFCIDDDDCGVAYFNEDVEWQTAIEQVIKNKKSILAQIDKESKDLKREKSATEKHQERVEQERNQTEKDAKRLGIQ